MPADSVLKKAPYKIPVVPDAERICVSVSCPNDPDHINNLLAAIATLGYWGNYQLEADRTAKETADVWMEIFRKTEEELCNCGLRNGPKGIEQFDADTGTWVPIQGNPAEGDPRTTGTVPAPWTTPPVGQTGNCLGAANIMAAFRDTQKNTSSLLGVEAGVFTMIAGMMNLVDFVIPVIGFIADLALDLASAAQDAGTALFDAAFDPVARDNAYQLFKCAIDCVIASDGRVTATNIVDINDYIVTRISTVITEVPQQNLWILFVRDWMNMFGPNGLTLLGNKSNILTADCSACDCDWESLFDFTTQDYASLLVDHSPYSLGDGYIAGVYGGYYSAAFVQPVMSPTVNISKVEVEYTAHFNPSVTQRRLIVTYYPEQGVDQPSLPQGDHLFDGFTAVHTGQTYVFADLLANDTAATIIIHRMLVRGQGTKPAGWP